LMGKVNYKAYTPISIETNPVAILADADEYFQDVAAVVSSMSEPKLFITSWILKPDIMLTGGISLQGLIADAVKKPNGACYILWNTLVAGITPAQLAKTAKALRSFVEGRLTGGAKIDDKLKIVFSTNLDYDLSPLFDVALLGYAASRVIDAPPTDQ